MADVSFRKILIWLSAFIARWIVTTPLVIVLVMNAIFLLLFPIPGTHDPLINPILLAVNHFVPIPTDYSYEGSPIPVIHALNQWYYWILFWFSGLLQIAGLVLRHKIVIGRRVKMNAFLLFIALSAASIVFESGSNTNGITFGGTVFLLSLIFGGIPLLILLASDAMLEDTFQ